MRSRLLLSALAITTLCAARVSTPVFADATGDTARGVIDKYKDAVVTFNVVVKFSGGPGGDDANQELEAQGFVLDSSGLIVTTNAAIDPISVFSSMGGDVDSAIGKMTSKVISIRIQAAGGEEIPAKVVLRDSDRNLAFIRPITAPTTPPASIDLKTAAPAKPGDNIFILSKMGKTGNRGPQISFTRITGQVERPRLFYVVQPVSGGGNPGNIVFNEQGQPLGLLSFKIAASSRRSFGFGGSDALQIVVPADDILEDAQQAPQIKDVKDTDTTPAAPAKKPATPAAKPTPKKPAAH